MLGYSQSQFLLARLARNPETALQFVDDSLHGATSDWLATTKSTLSVWEQVKHFFGYGRIGYLSIQWEIDRLAREDAKRWIRELCPPLPQNPTIQQYCQWDAVRSKCCHQIEGTPDRLWKKIEDNQWAQHSLLSKVVISVQEFFNHFWHELKLQGRTFLHWQLGIRLNSEDPFAWNANVRKIVERIERRTIAGELPPITMTFEHTVQNGSFSEYLFVDDQRGRAVVRVDRYQANNEIVSHNLDNSDIFKGFVTQATGAQFVESELQRRHH